MLQFTIVNAVIYYIIVSFGHTHFLHVILFKQKMLLWPQSLYVQYLHHDLCSTAMRRHYPHYHIENTKNKGRNK